MNKDDVAELVEKLTPALKLLEELEVGQDCAEYAYAKGNGFQSMTYIPEAFEALRELPATLDALTTLSARVETLETALREEKQQRLMETLAVVSAAGGSVFVSNSILSKLPELELIKIERMDKWGLDVIARQALAGDDHG